MVGVCDRIALLIYCPAVRDALMSGTLVQDLAPCLYGGSHVKDNGSVVCCRRSKGNGVGSVGRVLFRLPELPSGQTGKRRLQEVPALLPSLYNIRWIRCGTYFSYPQQRSRSSLPSRWLCPCRILQPHIRIRCLLRTHQSRGRSLPIQISGFAVIPPFAIRSA